jgi:DNA-binding response OmpR family regulator
MVGREMPAYAGARTARGHGWLRTVLLVEDDDAVRRTTRRLLNAHGLRVLEARSAAEARALDAEAHGEIDIVLTDNTLPGTTGLELLDSLRCRAAGAHAVVMSGYLAPVCGALGAPAVRWLCKPFDAAELLAAIGVAQPTVP